MAATPPTAIEQLLETVQRFGPMAPRIEPEHVYRSVGIRPDRKAHQRWLPEVADFIEQLPRLMRPRGLYRIDAVDELANRTLKLRSGTAYRGAIGQFLKHSEYVATFVVTIGSAVERLARRWMKGTNIMRGAIVDAVASEAVESIAYKLQDHLRQQGEIAGYDVTPRYSPGYCGMLITEQRKIFATLPAEQINVRLSESCLMSPIKSVSGLIGLAPAEKVGPARYPCEFCSHPDCMQRRAPFDERSCATKATFRWEAEPSVPARPADEADS
jgi:hypothetical protein